ncbi:Hypothetical protein SRAE_1000074100 [Strongyloides ratti]|uniref:Uncharacterized protein n=1 Tax=Strongyloides ratti TaxID=34506 RepID=A0A090MUV8_STRRB|nr:Hypothetical protein SRAE_1000074100 [Strongyloides ratti]CEF62468.1 Hypothetical protein SRAE_1000074100 [Strongyloides ratti]
MSSFNIEEMCLGINMKSFNKPNNYFCGGRFHIKNAIVIICIITCLRNFIEGCLLYDKYLYISSSDPKTMLFGIFLEIISILLMYIGYIKNDQNFLIPYIIIQIMFITIHGVILFLDILRCIWPSMPENILLEYKEGNTLEYIRLFVIFSIFIVDCYCLKVILKTYVYLENENVEFKPRHPITIMPQNQIHFTVEDEEVYSYGNPNYTENQISNEHLSSDEDYLDLTRDGYGKKKKSKKGDLK